MAYTKQDWKNLPDKSTPISAERMLYIESGVQAAAQVADDSAATLSTGRLSAASIESKQFAAGNYAKNAISGQFQKVKAKLALALGKTGQAKIAYIGHSMVAGTGAAPGDTDWPTQFARFLERDGYVRTGDGWIAATKNAPDARVVPGANWTVVVTGGMFLENQTNANPLTFQTLEACTEIDVHGALGTGAFTVSIDGGAPVTVTPAGGSGYGKNTFGGLANTTHTVTIARVSGIVRIHGIDCYRTTPGVRHYNVGVGGQQIGNLSSTSANFPGTFLEQIVKPDLTFLECIYNDASGALAPATFKSRAQTIITRLLAAGSTVVLVTDTPVNRASSIAEPYVAVLYELAAENGLLILDMLTALEGAVANGLIGGDNTHPTPAGYAAQARAVYKSMPL